jgi:hypothetical protein
MMNYCQNCGEKLKKEDTNRGVILVCEYCMLYFPRKIQYEKE